MSTCQTVMLNFQQTVMPFGHGTPRLQKCSLSLREPFVCTGKLRCGWRWRGGKRGSTGEGFRRKNGAQQDLLKFQTLTESEVWEVGDSLGIFFGGEGRIFAGQKLDNPSFWVRNERSSMFMALTTCQYWYVCPNHISLTGPSFFLSIFQSYCDCLYLFVWKKGKPWQTPDKESRTSTQIATVRLERNHCIIEVTFGHYLILSHSQLCLKNSLRPITVYGYKYTAIRIL